MRGRESHVGARFAGTRPYLGALRMANLCPRGTSLISIVPLGLGLGSSSPQGHGRVRSSPQGHRFNTWRAAESLAPQGTVEGEVGPLGTGLGQVSVVGSSTLLFLTLQPEEAKFAITSDNSVMSAKNSNTCRSRKYYMWMWYTVRARFSIKSG